MNITGTRNIDKKIIAEIESLIKIGDNKQALAAVREADSQHGRILSNLPLYLEIRARVLNLMGDYNTALASARYA